MSKCLKPCLYQGKGLETQWKNLIFNAHDLFCGCNDPINHLNEINKRDKWLRTKDAATTTEDGPDGDGDDFPLTEGDLKDLFGENEEDTR